MSEAELRRLHDRLREVGAQAFAARQLEACCHALIGAAHLANALGDEGLLNEAEADALSRLAWVDEHEPGHPLSSATAARRGIESHFVFAARQVRAMRLGLRLAAASRKGGRQGPPR